MDPRDVALHGYIERLALVLEAMGMTRMDGRVMVYMLVCTPPEQSLTGIAESLGVSKGAVSQSTRTLMRIGLIEAVPKRGSRAAWFRLRPNAWADLQRAKIAGLGHIRELADEGLSLLAHRPVEDRERLQSFRDLYAYFEKIMPEMIDAWIASKRVADNGGDH